jgi:hypothetical protein
VGKRAHSYTQIQNREKPQNSGLCMRQALPDSGRPNVEGCCISHSDECMKSSAFCVSHYCLCVVRDSSVGIATFYGLDGPGIESRWG